MDNRESGGTAAEKKRFRRIILIVTFGILLYWGLNNIQMLSGFFNSAVSLLTPLIVGFCIAFVINTLLCPVERLWDSAFSRLKGRIHTRVKRPVCLALSAVIALGAIFAVLFMIIPELKRTASSFVQQLPQYISGLGGYWTSFTEFMARYNIVLPQISLNGDMAADMVNSFLVNNGNSFINTTFDITSSIFSAAFNTVLAFAFSVYLLAQKEKILHHIKRLLYAVCSTSRANRITEFAAFTHRTFTKFVTGQLTEAIIIGILCFIGMLLLCIPYAAVISILVGFTALIPVFGAFFGTAVGAFLILLVNPVKALWFVVFIVVLQQLEGNLIYPRVVGKSVGLPGILVLAAVTIGGGMFGIVGMLFSVPICSVLYCAVLEFVAAQLKRKKISP